MSCNRNAENPNAPEYLKPHKPENNSGCGCSCSSNGENVSSNPPSVSEPDTTIIKTKNTREDYI